MEKNLTFLRKHKTLIIKLVLLGLLVAVSAYLRFFKISEYMTFLGDEGRDVLVVKHMIVDHKFTLLGPTASVGGFFMGPIYYYFMLPFLWAWQLDPVGPAIMVALFGTLTVLLVYKFGKSLYGEFGAFAAAGLYAVSPFIIAYSRSSWNPNLVPFFSTLLLYLLWKNTFKPSIWGVVSMGIILGIGLQLHYVFLFLFGVVGLWYLGFYRNYGFLKVIILTVLGFIIGYSPFLAFEMRHGFPNTKSVFQFITQGKDTGFTVSEFFNTLGNVTYRLFGRLLLRLPDEGVLDTKLANYKELWLQSIRLVTVSVFGVLGIRLVLLFLRQKKKISKSDLVVSQREIRAILIMVVWFLVILITFGFYKKQIYDYYFGIFYTLPFLAFGYVVSRLGQHRWGQVLAGLLVVGLLWFNWQGRPFLFPPNNQLAQAKRIASVAFEKTEGKPFNFALVATHNSDHAYRYFFEAWGNPPVTIENTVNDPERKTVTDQLIVICEQTDCKPLGHPLWEIAGFGQAQVVGEWEVPFVKVIKLIHFVQP